MFSCLQILEAFLWFVLITLLNVTLIILTLSVSRLLNLLLRLVAFLLFLNPQCLASIKIGRASCRERVYISVDGVFFKKIDRWRLRPAGSLAGERRAVRLPPLPSLLPRST